MENFPTLLPVVAAALFNASGEILLQRRPEGTHMPGLWEFPGGKIEPEETPEAALVRELHEELGIGTQIADLSPFAFASESLGGRHLVLLLYICRRWHGEPRALHASRLIWAAPDSLHEFVMPPADGPLVAALQKSFRV